MKLDINKDDLRKEIRPLKYNVYRFLEMAFRRLEYWAQEMAMKYAICPDCGRNGYTGKPCK